MELVKDNIDVLLISETKVDSIFPSEQFAIDNYKLFCGDRNCFSGGLMFYVNETFHAENYLPNKMILTLK